MRLKGRTENRTRRIGIRTGKRMTQGRSNSMAGIRRPYVERQ